MKEEKEARMMDLDGRWYHFLHRLHRRCLGGKDAESSFRDTELDEPGRQSCGENRKLG